MARALGVLFVVGAAITALSLVAPHPSAFDAPRLWAGVAFAALIGAALILTADRVSRWAIHLALITATVVITWCIYHGGEAGTMYSFFYVWVSCFAFFFLGRRWGLFHVLLVAIAFGMLLVLEEHGLSVARWLLAISTITVAGALIDAFATRLRARADESAAHVRALSAVASVAHQLARTTDTEPPAGMICNAIASALDSAGASLWQPSEDGTQMIAVGSTETSLVGLRQPIGGPPSGVVSCFTDNKVIFSSDKANDPRVNRRLGRELGLTSALFQPVLDEEIAIAVLVVHWADRMYELDANTAATIALIADETAIAIQRSALLRVLEQSAHTDALTGLLNRRGWADSLSRELARARRLDSPLCVAMLDLDYFKRFNDENGHLAGDRVLREASAQWTSSSRDGDVLARYGGDEFALALPACQIDDAMRQLQRLQENTSPHGSISAGVVSWDGAESGFGLIERADQALYAAKREGRARIVAA